MTWNPPSNNNGDSISAYNIYIDDGLGGLLRPTGSTLGFTSSLQYTITQDGYGNQLVKGRTYTVAVTAQNVAGESA